MAYNQSAPSVLGNVLNDQGNPVVFQGAYRLILIQPEYRHDLGLLAVPLAPVPELKTTVEVVNVSAPVQLLIVTWEMDSDSRYPQLPDPDLHDPNLVLLSKVITPQAATPTADFQNRQYHISGRYEYVVLSPFDQTTGYPIGVTPIDSQSVPVIETDNFVPNLIFPSNFNSAGLNSSIPQAGGSGGGILGTGNPAAPEGSGGFLQGLP